VAALIAAAEVRFKLTESWRFVDAGPGRLALVLVALGVDFLATGVSCLLAAADLVGVAGFLSVVLEGVALVSLRLSSALPLASSLLDLFFSLQ